MAVWQATVTAPVNIAVIKYWGKRDTQLILPTNSTLSLSLDQNHFCTTTSGHADPTFEKDCLCLNGKEEHIKAGGRLDTCIKAMKALRKKFEDETQQPDQVSTWCVHIASFNNFPTAAGLASSAAGFAALVYCLAKVYRLPYSCTELSIVARQGSGSACRSLFGGFVAWQMGSNPSGEDSLAVQVASEVHWPDMHALICVVSDEKKATSSTDGMQRTVETSSLFQHRIKNVVPERMEAMKSAILQRDFDSFAKLTMRDSNQFHAVCVDTEPPVFYLNDKSQSIIALVQEFNRISIEEKKGYRAAYTFDAGPNAVIYALQENMKDIINLITTYFPLTAPFSDNFSVFGPQDVPGKMPLPLGFNVDVAKTFARGALKGLIHTKIGGGPRVLPSEQALLDEFGMPRAVPEAAVLEAALPV